MPFVPLSCAPYSLPAGFRETTVFIGEHVSAVNLAPHELRYSSTGTEYSLICPWKYTKKGAFSCGKRFYSQDQLETHLVRQHGLNCAHAVMIARDKLLTQDKQSLPNQPMNHQIVSETFTTGYDAWQVTTPESEGYGPLGWYRLTNQGRPFSLPPVLVRGAGRPTPEADGTKEMSKISNCHACLPKSLQCSGGEIKISATEQVPMSHLLHSRFSKTDDNLATPFAPESNSTLLQGVEPAGERTPEQDSPSTQTSSTDSVSSFDASDMRGARLFAEICLILTTILESIHNMRSPQIQSSDSTSDTMGNGQKTSSSSSASSSSPPKSAAGKRKINQKGTPNQGNFGNNQIEEEDENEDVRGMKKKRLKVNDSHSILSWACPYHKSDPARYSGRQFESKSHHGCEHYFLKDISAVKQHLDRIHKKPSYYCPSCYLIFDTSDERDVHAKARICSDREDPFKDRIPDKAYALIKRKRRNESATKTWYFIYETLFPGAQRPDSPYAEDWVSQVHSIALMIFGSLGPQAEQTYNHICNSDFGIPIPPLHQDIFDQAFQIYATKYTSAVQQASETKLSLSELTADADTAAIADQQAAGFDQREVHPPAAQELGSLAGSMDLANAGKNTLGLSQSEWQAFNQRVAVLVKRYELSERLTSGDKGSPAI